MRDLYGDVWLDKAEALARAARAVEGAVRLGQPPVELRTAAPMERPDALNSAVEGERDLGASLMWASPTARQRFRDLTALRR